MLVLLRRSFSYVILGVFIWIYLNPRNFNPRNFNFLVGFSFKTIFAPPRPITTLVSKDVEFSCASFDLYEKFARWCPPTQTPTRKFKTGISIFSSQGMGSTLVSLRMIFKALQSELFRFKFHSLSSKILKIPEFSLLIRWRYNLFGYFNNFFNKSISVNFLIWILAISSEHLKFSFWNSHSREHCHDVIGFNIEVIIRFKLA